MTHLHLIYEVGNFKDTVVCLLWVLICPLAALGGWGIHYYNKNFNDDESSGYDVLGMSNRFKNMRIGFLMMITTGIIAPFVGYYVIKSYIEVNSQFNNKKYKVVEGRVANFQDTCKKPYSDTFTIDTVHFRYGGGSLRYNKTKAEGGVIRNGLYVKIIYIEDEGDIKSIWRLETE